MAKVEARTRTLSAGRLREHERDFSDFISSIAVSKEELVAIVNMPDYSIQQVKDYLRKGILTGDCLGSTPGPRPAHRPALAGTKASPQSRPPSVTGDAAAAHRPLNAARVLSKVFHLAASSRSTASKSPLPEL